MVIIRINGKLKAKEWAEVAEGIHAQAELADVIVLPHFCELLNEVPADEEIKVIHQDARVAELEKELAAAMAYITEDKNCDACKHIKNVPDTCPCECEKCRHEDCYCRDCTDGSKWEWRGA